MRSAVLILILAGFAAAQQEPTVPKLPTDRSNEIWKPPVLSEATQKQADAAREKIKAKDSKSKIEGLKAAAELRGDGISLLPLVFKEMAATGKKVDEKVTLQAVIASEAIDDELHGLVMGLKPGLSWGQKCNSLKTLSWMPVGRLKSIEHVFEWMAPSFATIKQSTKLVARRPLVIVVAPQSSDDAASLLLMNLLPKFDDGFHKEYIALVTQSLKCGHPHVRERAYQEVERGTNRDDLKKRDKAEMFLILNAGLGDPDEDIVFLCVKSIGNLGPDGAGAAATIRTMAATHGSKPMRDAASETLKKIDK